MTTAIIGVGKIGGTVARYLDAGGEPVVVASKDGSRASEVAESLSPLAHSASIDEAIASADTVVLALWLDAMREVIADHGDRLGGKTVIDPSNPFGFDPNGAPMRTLPEDQSAASLVASLIPASAHYVKAFGTLGADDLATNDHREPRRAVLFYATDDAVAQATVERLIELAGFDPLKVGGVADAWRIEAPGGDLQGGLFDADEAAAKVASGGPS